MDIKNTMEPRFSLNSTHLPSPIAESTCLNINGTCSSSSFRWGGSSMTLKNRSNSSISLNNTQSGLISETINTSLSQRSKVNISRIDPRMYADVQSKGLASRIVKYHENGTRLNRSMSMTNLYHKPGQFPIVHLKKTELPSRAITQNISMTRIAPPEKSIFHGNTVSSLLRSNSIIGFQKSDEEISCENRPILHPPPTENDLAPTRSVLEVLKEISRKRINNDDLSRNDTIKKYCNRDRDSADIVDLATLNSEKTNTTLNGKRQREQFNNQQPLNKKHQSLNSNQRSPEQIAKKRLCSYNNDIKSSLSSSLIHVNKRKYNEQKNGLISNDFNGKSPSYESYEKQQSKVHRAHTEFRFQDLSKTLSCNEPITPIPPTPLNQTIDSSNLTKLGVSVPAHRTISEPVFYSNNRIASASPNKKKLTLFNKNYEETDIKEGLRKTSDSHTVDSEFESIQFVKPRKCSSSLGIKNPLIERTQKSKLALMLCGLRGELYQGNEDEIDAVQNEVNDKSQSTPIAVSKSEDGTNLAVKNTYNKTTNSIVATNTNVIENSIPKTLVETNNSTSTNVSKVTPSSTISTTTTTTFTMPTVNGTSFTGGLNFSQSSSKGNSTISTSIEKQSPLTGIKLTPQSLASPVTNKTLPSFAVNTSSTTTAISTNVNTSAPLETLNIPVTSTTAISIKSTPTVTSTASSPGGFAFKNTLQNSNINFETLPIDKPPVCIVSNSLATNSNSSAFEKSGSTYSSGFTAVQSTITSPISISTAPIIQFGNHTNTTVSTGDTAKPFAFGSSGTFTVPTNNTTVASITPTFGSVTPVSFGSKTPNDTTKNNSKLDISTSASATTKSAFKSPSAIISSTSPSGTTDMHLSNTSNTFSFGAVTNKPSATATPFPKVQNEHFNSAANSTFVINGNTNTNTDTTVTSTSASASITASSSTFSFGAANTINTNAGNSNVNTTFKFSSQPTNSVFGNPLSSNSLNDNNIKSLNTSQTTASNVGESAQSTQSQSQSTSLFGAATATKPFAFGSNSSTFGGGSTLISTTPAQTKNIFGTSSTPSSNASVNVVKPSFNFGGNSPSKNTESKSLFGGTNCNSGTGNINNFGALGTSTNTFAFGSNNSGSSNNLFGSGNNQNQSNGFSFGSNAGTVQSKPTAVTGPSAFTFGNSNALGNNSTATQPPTNTVTPFSFGNAGSGNIPNKSDAATFSFGSNNTISNTGTISNTLFSSQNANATSASNPQTFNFNSSGTDLNATSPTNSNIFAAPNMANPNERRIRRATRRLQK